MAETTFIEWAHASWGPWYGCIQISAGCKNCYAARDSIRMPGVFGKWGPEGSGTRRVAAESAWKKPIAWDRKAAAAGEKWRVFPSMCDPFEDWSGPMVDAAGDRIIGDSRGDWAVTAEGGRLPNDRPIAMRDVRLRFADLIRRTPNLTWLLLTKRPENAARMLAEMFGTDRDGWPTNFRVGASVEDQKTANARLPHLLALDWPNFVSYEPALGPIDFERIEVPVLRGAYLLDALRGTTRDYFDGRFEPGCRYRRVEWLIAGGESGPGARSPHPSWFRSARDQCRVAGTPYLLKQWGEHHPYTILDDPRKPTYAVRPDGRMVTTRLYYRNEAQHPGAALMTRVGKKRAGRTLDGVVHDEFPAEVAHA